jgi:hypothetical protein
MYNKTNFNFKKTKKAFVEITSFALLTSLILVLSLTTYVFVKDILDDKIISLERDSIESNFKKLNLELQKIQNFPGSSMSYPFNLKKGILVFSNTSIIYYSLVDFNSLDSICFDNLCYSSQAGFEILTLNLNTPFTYKEKFTLRPENYQLIFTNIGGNKIETKFK